LIINERYERRLSMIITSNQSLEDIWKLYFAQISSRLAEMCKAIKFSGEDRRQAMRPNFSFIFLIYYIMASLNQVQLIWNLTADPEIKSTERWQTVANFSIATNRAWKNSEGEKQTAVDYHNIVVWWKLAEICEQYLSKWKQVFIQWRLSTRSWEGDDGVKRYKTEVVAEEMQMLWQAPKKDDDEEEEKPVKKKAAAPAKKKPVDEDEVSISDLPF
jgi:single-strand DNA-binding protein